MSEAYIIDAVRTPRGIGKPGKGALSHLHPQHLAATVLAAIRDRNNLDTATVDDIVWSTSSQNGKQGGDLGRMAALSAGYDTKASGTTLDRFCGGGISSVNFAAASMASWRWSIGVVPAWFEKPSTVTSIQWSPTIPSTTPTLSPACSSRPPCSMCSSM